MTVLVPPVGPVTAARRYLLDELDARGNTLPVGMSPPAGTPTSYALLSRPGTNKTPFLGHYLIRVRVFDRDVVRLERNADLLHGLMLSAVHRKVTVPGEGSVWITGATHHYGPGELDDEDVPLFGMQSAVFWTIGLKPPRR
ncbi:tail terminator [Mycobacterium phage Paola]|uniref:Tail terminator n=3 Tax=Kratiovirus TaxID=2948788 RepID=A0A1C9EGP8_9CAUD|nr:tail terminator [Mycobacterium phage OkiRoe]YP_009282260.1 tail terminator [Mycobacterium phage Gengar]YP_009950727.1 tail terminator [Mycobacterium phage Leston]YP_009950821.1 tail terminator [Mycobacterium phage Paola]ASR85804.1 tail terminator [Mycobacterium phage Guillsminger]AHZ95576.1 tail terminator [Mycobacterium phage OkiRoe]AON96670.1 tail terminator [Mycobacterium phage Gengar]AVO25806.1 tail terminator [Mycobacterium phage Paola]AVR77128.1 tail terminator [Mycobacterium phage